MNYQGLIGSSGAVQSPLVSHSDLINMYLERTDVRGSSPTGQALYSCPGFSAFQTTSGVGFRGALAVGIYNFAVMGGTLIEVTEVGEVVRGSVAQDSNPATLSYNGPSGGQLFITSGGNGYCYDLTSHLLTLVLSGEATMGLMIDAYFLAFNVTNGHVRYSAVNDGTTWDPTKFFARSQAPDPWQSMILGNQGQIILHGTASGEAWFDRGQDPDNPFEPIPGAFWNYGTRSPFSVCVAGDLVVWLSHTNGGAATIVGMRAYSPSQISSNAVNTSLGFFDRTTGIDDCECVTYTEEGHTFAVFSMLAAKLSWGLDVTTGDWHQRGKWNTATGQFDVWAPRAHMHAFGKHLIGTRDSNVIYQMSVGFYTETDGKGIRRVRIGPPLWAKPNRRLQVDRLDLMMDTGVGLATGQGSDPKIAIQTSTDSRTWTPLRQASMGTLGAYGTRVYWTRLGSAERSWCPQLVISDPVPCRIASGELAGSGFSLAEAAA